ncbi:MAG: hypothetical protein HY748_16835 [Elusimicrobia bacterium]|nr:hypothetical protein [Elusimicrobiota bacterium]
MNDESAKEAGGKDGDGWRGEEILAAAKTFLAEGGTRARRDILHIALELHRLLAAKEA